MAIYRNINGTTSEEFSIGKGGNKVSIRIYDNKLQGKDKDGEWYDLIFDKYTNQISADTESSTSSTNFKNKLTLNTNYIPAGKYRVGWSYEWLSPMKTTCDTKILLDDEIELPNKIQDTESNDNSAWLTTSSFEYRDLSEGTHKLEIFYRTSKKNKAIKIRNARIELWRVS